MNSNAVCAFCGVNEVDGRYREVIGIEELRAQGGANKIIGRRETGKQACRDCMTKIRDGIPIEQGGLFG